MQWERLVHTFVHVHEHELINGLLLLTVYTVHTSTCIPMYSFFYTYCTRIGTPGKKLDWEEGRELGCPKLTYFNYLRFNTGAAKIIDLATVKSFLSTYKIIFSTCLHIPIIQPVRKRNTKKSILLYRIHWYMVFFTILEVRSIWKLSMDPLNQNRPRIFIIWTTSCELLAPFQTFK